MYFICGSTHYFVWRIGYREYTANCGRCDQIILALAVTVIVMMQEGNERGLGAISGGADTFFSKNSAATPQARLRKKHHLAGYRLHSCTIVLYVLVSVA